MRHPAPPASPKTPEQGSDATLAEQFPGLELDPSNQYAGATTESAYKTAENLLVRFKQLDGVFCPNESTTFGMLRALQDAKRAAKVRFVGFDASAKLVEALASDQIHGLAVQNPFAMGEGGVRAAVQHLAGKPVEARIDTGVTIATAANMVQPEVKALLSPELDTWLK
jgi:ribose transport system substrate-binding protein